jgi:hypothetical protein
MNLAPRVGDGAVVSRARGLRSGDQDGCRLSPSCGAGWIALIRVMVRLDRIPLGTPSSDVATGNS